jgi:hypothetical protein
MHEFEHILNWTLKVGSHEFPGPDGGTCINEAAVVAAGFPYRAIRFASDMPPCFSRVISAYALALNDLMPNDQRQRLMSYVLRLSETADTPAIEQQRAEYLAMRAVTVFAANALDTVNLPEYADQCRNAQTLSQAREVALATARAAAGEAAIGAAAAGEAAQAAARAEAAAAATDMLPLLMVTAAQAAARAAGAAAGAEGAAIWDAALVALDGVLAIGQQPEPLDVTIAAECLERSKRELT